MIFSNACSDNSKIFIPEKKEKILEYIEDDNLLELKKLLVQQPKLLNKHSDNHTLLHYAIVNRASEELIKFLLQSGITPKTQDDYKSTPLHAAAFRFYGIDILKLLIDKGADINAIDSFGDTPLDMAYKSYNSILEIVENPPSPIQNIVRLPPQSIEEKEKYKESIKKAYQARIDFLKKHGAKTGEELKKQPTEQK